MPSLALFGATGNTGKAVLALALEQGYVVRALVRRLPVGPPEASGSSKSQPSLR